MCLTKNVTKNNFHVIWSVVHTVSVEAKMSGKKESVKTEKASRQSLTPLRLNALKISRPIRNPFCCVEEKSIGDQGQKFSDKTL